MSHQKAMSPEDRYEEAKDQYDAEAAQHIAQSMDDIYREELHDMYVRKNGMCGLCNTPIAREEDATVTHIMTAYGNRPVLAHASEVVRVSIAAGKAMGALKPLRVRGVA